MPDFITSMVEASRDRVEHAKRQVPIHEMRRRALARPKRQPLALHVSGFDVIAEIKRNKPSGDILNTAKGHAAREMVTMQGDAYARGGAAAVSVLTEPTAFSGDIEDVRTAALSAPIPIMRKDFLVDPYQVFEARAYDSTGVLLIAQVLEPKMIASFLVAAEQTRQFILLEIFDKEELRMVETVCNAVADRDIPLFIGVNARHLTTLQLDTDRFATLVPHMPTNVPLVAESGLHSANDIRNVASLGYHVALVGTALMQSDSPAKTLSRFIDAGREASKTCVSE